MLIVLGCVLAPVAGVSVWINNQVSETDRFVRTMTPLVSDPDVQNALTNRLTATVFQYVDVEGIADDAVDALAAQGLPPQIADRLSTLTPTLASAVTGFVRDKIAELVASPAFAAAWNQAIETAHRQMVTLLSGEGEAIVVRGDTVYLELGPFIVLAKDRLSDAGLTAVSLVPDVNPTVALAKADTLVRAQTAYSTLDTVADVLPWVVLLLLVVGVYLARNRFRALVGTGLGIGLSMVVLGAGLLVARGLLVGAVPARSGPGDGVRVRHHRDLSPARPPGPARPRPGARPRRVPRRPLGERRPDPALGGRPSARHPRRSGRHRAGWPPSCGRTSGDCASARWLSPS